MAALVASSWAWMEFNLGQMFEMATAEIKLINGSIVRQSHPLAIASFGALESLSARLSVIEASLELVLPASVPGFETLAVQIRRCAKSRNRIVHATWATSERYPNDIIIMNSLGRCEKWTPKDFQEVIRRINAQSGEISEFTSECMRLQREALLQEQGGSTRVTPQA